MGSPPSAISVAAFFALYSVRFLVAVLLSNTVVAVTYSPTMHQAQWTVDSSVFACRMTYNVPYYGNAIFIRRAGESQRFYLDALTSRLKSGKALLESLSPVWKPRGGDARLGYVSVKQGMRPVTLGSGLSQQMLTELHRGQELVFTRRPWYGADESIRVALSSITFQAAYRQYLSCLAGLLPVNFEQVSRTAIYFASGSDELKPSEIQKLDNVALYVKADASVVAYVIDGHTDSVGLRADNLALSQRRAEMVSQYLINRGVAEDKISTRWHGERYPVRSNNNRTGRAANRRVTIRLDRQDEVQLGNTAVGANP
jgi:sodium-type flagellar protein MotY